MFDSFTASFMCGLIVLLIFSWDQLNRPILSGSDSSGKDRILRTLLPKQISRIGVYVRGYAIYAFILSGLYVFLCFWGGPFIALTVGKTGLENSPAFPLAISLAFVGITPATGLFKRLETRVRAISYRAVGIPDAFLAYKQQLIDAVIDENDIPDGILNRDDESNFNAIAKQAKIYFKSSEHYLSFKQDLIRIVAFQAWVEMEKPWPDRAVFEQFGSFISQIQESVDDLLDDLEDITHREDFVGIKDRWEKLRKRADSSSDDISSLFALLSSKAGNAPADGTPISSLLNLIFRDAVNKRSQSDQVVDVSIALLALVFLVESIIFYIFFRMEVDYSTTGDDYSGAALKAVNFIIVIFASISISLMIRRLLGDQWINIFQRGDRVLPLSQLLFVVVPSSFAAAIAISWISAKDWLSKYTENIASGGSRCSGDFGIFDCYLEQTAGNTIISFMLFGIAGGIFSLSIISSQDIVSRSYSYKASFTVMMSSFSALFIYGYNFLRYKSNPEFIKDTYIDLYIFWSEKSIPWYAFISYESAKWFIVHSFCVYFYISYLSRIFRQTVPKRTVRLLEK